MLLNEQLQYRLRFFVLLSMGSLLAVALSLGPRAWAQQVGGEDAAGPTPIAPAGDGSATPEAPAAGAPAPQPEAEGLNLFSLLLAGGVPKPVGEFHSSMQLVETGLFDRAGFKRLHFAGHPEGNRDIDPDGGMKVVDEALEWKQKFSERTDAKLALATQFAFDAGPIIRWADRLREAGIAIPVHIGIAGPAKLQTLIKFAIACGVGPSLKVLQKRAMDVTKLLMPYEPTDVVAQLAAHKAANPDFNIEAVHFFPLGGIRTNAQWVTDNGGAAGRPANAN